MPVGRGACLAIAISVIALGYHTSDQLYKQYAGVIDAGPLSAPNPPVADNEWRYYGRTADGDRFSPLAQITPENVSQLKKLLEFRSGDMPKEEDTEKGREY